MDESLYADLNKLSNDEFKDITMKSPLRDYLDVDFETQVLSYQERKNNNVFKVKTNTGEDKDVFIKYITLVDFLKFLIGKYKNEDLTTLPCEGEKENQSKYEKYINEPNNYAYVDSLFYYASSVFSKQHNFPHGIPCYDQFICKKKNCKINIADDLEYLCDSNFFNENINKLYSFEDSNISDLFMTSQKDKLTICEDQISLDNIEEIQIDSEEKKSSLCDISCSECNPLMCNENTNTITDISNQEEGQSNEENSQSDDEDSYSDDSKSDVVHTSDEDEDDEDDDDDDEDDDEDDGEDDDEDDDEDGEEGEEGEDDEDDEDYEDSEQSDDSEDEEDVILYIHEIPTQVVVLEKCEDTLDSLLEKDELSTEELESAIFQIITILYTYQKVFQFTHNDLHTNNIMYTNTNKTHLVYTIKNKTYKIPTFGKIYKIIDFGRAIYTYQNKLMCSDSFSTNGTAYTQYNFGPYYNPKKPVLEPNYSFDLCRLACSMFDFICDDIQNIQKYRDATPIHDVIFSWLYDDNGRNMLYRSNGEDKYPGFKLYKMISKIVHQHLPENQYDHPCFQKFISTQEEINHDTMIVAEIDKMIV